MDYQAVIDAREAWLDAHPDATAGALAYLYPFEQIVATLANEEQCSEHADVVTYTIPASTLLVGQPRMNQEVPLMFDSIVPVSATSGEATLRSEARRFARVWQGRIANLVSYPGRFRGDEITTHKIGSEWLARIAQVRRPGKSTLTFVVIGGAGPQEPLYIGGELRTKEDGSPVMYARIDAEGADREDTWDGTGLIGYYRVADKANALNLVEQFQAECMASEWGDFEVPDTTVAVGVEDGDFSDME